MNTTTCTNCGNVFLIAVDPLHLDGQEACPICGSMVDEGDQEVGEV